jgi:hypothetical protein
MPAGARGLRPCRLFDVIPSHADVQLGPGQAETPGGVRLVPPAVPQDLGDRLPLHGAEVGGVAAARQLDGGFQGQMLWGDERVLAQDRRTLEGVAQFADVSRPVVLQERLACLARQAGKRPGEGAAELLQERFAQRQDIRAAFAERRDVDVEDRRGINPAKHRQRLAGQVADDEVLRDWRTEHQRLHGWKIGCCRLEADLPVPLEARQRQRIVRQHLVDDFGYLRKHRADVEHVGDRAKQLEGDVEVGGERSAGAGDRFYGAEHCILR